MLISAFPAPTPRECEVLLWLFRGKTDPVIARIPATASTHVRNLLLKLAVELRHAATMEVVRAIICRRPSATFPLVSVNRRG